MRAAFGFSRGASSKNVSRSTPLAMVFARPSASYPVSQQITWSTSALSRSLRSTFLTYSG